MSDSVPLKFDGKALETLTLAANARTEAATIRFNDEKNIQQGTVLSARPAETPNVEIAVLDVTCVVTCPLWRAVDIINARNALYGSSTATEAVISLNKHYRHVSPTETVKVIFYVPLMDSDAMTEDTEFQVKT